MLHARAIAALVALCALLRAPAAGASDQPADLPAEIEARVIKTAEAELGRVERVLRAQPGVDQRAVANVTLPLQSAVEQDLGNGPVKIYPRAIYEVCLSHLKKGESRDAVGRVLVDLHHRGELRGQGVEVGAKRVASFVFDKERLKYPDPHLPPSYKPPAGERVMKGIYLICVGTDGKVTKVTTVTPIPGADQMLIAQLQRTWLYKPQPVPVCTPRQFVFQFN